MKFFRESKFFIFPHCVFHGTQCGKSRNSLPCKFFSSNQFIVKFFNKTSIWRNFCEKTVAVRFRMCMWESYYHEIYVINYFQFQFHDIFSWIGIHWNRRMYSVWSIKISREARKRLFFLINTSKNKSSKSWN